MTETENRRSLILFGLTLIAFVVVLVWLARGSSGTPARHGWQPGWATLPSMTLSRRALAAVVHNHHLYAIGGMDGQGHYIRSVEYAPIHPDGNIGAWRTTSELNQGRFYLAAVALDNYLYALGGGSGERGNDNMPIASVERALVNADGSLGPWQVVGEMTTPRRGLKAVIHGRTIYALGGYNGAFLKDAERSSIDTNGMPGPWQREVNEASIDRYIHAAAIQGDHIYLLGGHMRNPNQPSYGDVEHTTIQADGRLVPWRIAPHPLRTPRLVADAVAVSNHLYILGGHTGAERLASVEVSPLAADGSLGPWRNTTALPSPRSATAVTTDGQHIYVLGGGSEDDASPAVFMATPGPRGDLGIPNQ